MSADSSYDVPTWTVGDRLRKARAKTGLNTRDFAEEIGVSQKTITDAESDRRQHRGILLRAYAMRTRTPLAWLETGEDPTRAPDGEGVNTPTTTRHARTGVWGASRSGLTAVAA